MVAAESSRGGGGQMLGRRTRLLDFNIYVSKKSSMHIVI